MPNFAPRGIATLNQLFAEEEARRRAAFGFGPNYLSTSGTTITSSAKVFTAFEDVPEGDLRDMSKEERARLERHVQHNLSARIIADMIAAGQATFEHSLVARERVRRFTLEATPPGLSAASPPPAPPQPKQPSQMLLAAERSAGVDAGRKDAMAEVAKTLAEVEAGLIPGADAGFVVVLLRDKLGLAQ